MNEQNPIISEQNPNISRPWLNQYDSDTNHNIPLYEKTLIDFLDDAAKSTPKRLACIFENTKITYEQLQKEAEILASSLRDLGVKPGDRVAIMLPNIPQAIISFWGIIKVGAIVVMLNPLYMEKEIIHHIHNSGVKHLILLDLLWPKIYALLTRLPIEKYIVTTISQALSFPLNYLYDFKEKRSKRKVFVPYATHVRAWKTLFESKKRYCAKSKIKPDSIALLQYTGGTTGLAKGVELTHQNLGSNCMQIIEILRNFIVEKHSFVSILPFFHVYGLSVGLIIPTAIKATVLPLPRYVPQDVLKLIKKHKPTILPGAPSIYNSLMQQKNIKNYNLQSIKLCISGSAPLAEEHYLRFKELTGATIVEGYGLTEASPITHLSPLDFSKHKLGSIGLPLPGTDARIVDLDNGTTILPPGQLGELIVKGPQVMKGYWNHPEATVSTLRDEWLYTGDIATMDEDGFFHIMDRKKDIIIVAGYNVYPREIDETLLEHPAIEEAVAVGLSDDTRGEIIKAYIVLKPKMKLTRPEIVSWCRNKLASYKVPRVVEFRESLPKTLVGKVLRRALIEEELEKKNLANNKQED